MANPLDPERFHELDPYHQAVALCRYWWLTYEETPRWRIWKKHKAYIESQRWGQIAIAMSEEANAGAEE